jgi:hypothetical protein
LSTGHSLCSACAVGSFTENESAILCSSCAPGQAQGSSGQTSCLPCVEGQFAAALGSSRCTQCGAGTASAAQGTTACPECKVVTPSVCTVVSDPLCPHSPPPIVLPFCPRKVVTPSVPTLLPRSCFPSRLANIKAEPAESRAFYVLQVSTPSR